MKDKLLKNQLWDMVRLMSVNLETAYRPLVEVHGLTTMQSRVLIAVNETREPTIGYISKIIGISSPNASNMCKKLEQDGFIQKIRSTKDERVVVLKLTQKGEETLSRISSDLKKIYGHIIEKISPEEFEKMMEGIKLLNNILREFENFNKNNQELS